MNGADQDAARRLRADAAGNERAILDAAAVLLADDPGTGTDEIAAAAGVSRATVYRRFPSRADLVTALRLQAAVESLAALAAAEPGAGPAGPALDRVLGGLADIALRYQALFLEGLAGEQPVEEYHAIRTELTELVSRAQREGALNSGPPPGWIVSIISAHLAALARAAKRDLFDSPEHARSWFRTTLLHGVAPPRSGDA